MRQLIHLLVGEGFEIFPTVRVLVDVVVDIAVGRGPFVSPVIVVVPVGLREIESRPKARTVESVHNAFSDVGLGVLAVGAFGAGAAVFGLVAVEHAETIVVFGSKNHILHTGSLGHSRHLVGAELGGIEGAVKVPIIMFVLVVGGPFAVDPRLVAEIP